MPWPKKHSNDDSEKLYLAKDKIAKVVLLDDEPELYYTHYVSNKTEKCSAPDCTHCSAGIKRNEKGKMRVRDTADNKEKLLAGSAAMFQALHEAVEMCGNRNGFIFALKRTGESKSTRYHVSALPLATVSAPTDEDDKVPF